MPLLDPHHETTTVQIYVGTQDVTGYAVWAQCSFDSSAAAAPGTCTIVLRDHLNALSFTPGQTYGLIRLILNGEPAWTGYLMTLEQGYFFPDKTERKWTLRGVDLNILFDKLRLWNHTDPTKSLDGGGYYQRTTLGTVRVPPGEPAKNYVAHMLNDTDWGDITNPALYTSFSDDLGPISEGNFRPPDAGVSLRDFMIATASNIQRTQQGSIVWYIGANGYFYMKLQDTDSAPWSVGDNSSGVNVRNLTVSTDISSIKNDVMIWTGNLNPDPESAQQYLLFRHNQLTASVNQFGRFQYGEIMGQDWLQGMINVRSTKILYQEATPKMNVTFTTYRHGLYPGQILTVASSTHTYKVWNTGLTALEEVSSFNIPIRAISYRFVTPSVVEYQVTCSYDTQDPWGLLLALKRPPTTGFVQPSFQVVDLIKYPETAYEDRQVYTFIREWPAQMTGGKWQCMYGYIRFSMVVYVNGLRLYGVPSSNTTVGFLETDPYNGVFQLASGVSGRPYVEYHVWRNR